MAILPSGLQVQEDTLIVPYGHFTWGEATYGLTRIPQNLNVQANIVNTAKNMEAVRETLGGHPIYVSSWLRTPESNKAIKGAKKSRHLTGDAVDFCHRRLPLIQIYNILEKWHVHGGLALYKTHVHIDFRGERVRWFPCEK